MKKYFAVSDVHSFATELYKALSNKGFERDNPEHILIVCGDAFDRGQETLELFDFLRELSEKDRLVYVRGNHEDLLECCFEDMCKNRPIGYHHRSNGTTLTIADVSGYTEWDIAYRTYNWKVVRESVEELLTFINDNCVDYFELGKTVFVHGWVPTGVTSDEDKTLSVPPDWRTGNWREARWENGMEMWYFNLIPEEYTVVCGHWHCSYGWSHIDHKYKEFPCPTHPDFQLSFMPYIRNGIIAIDACTMHSGKVNCVVFNELGELVDE